MVKILSDSAILHPLEELFISGTIASTLRRYTEDAWDTTVHLEGAQGDHFGLYRCEIAILTEPKPVIVVGIGASPGQAFLNASEDLDRHLYAASSKGRTNRTPARRDGPMSLAA